MITFTCDLCGGPAIPRMRKMTYPDFVGSQVTVPELVYQGVHLTFFARKMPAETSTKQINQYIQRDLEIADLCQDCLLRAVERGTELKAEDLEAVVKP